MATIEYDAPEYEDVDESDKIALMAHLGKEDLLFFMRDILGYDWINEVEHRELCDFMMAGVKGTKQHAASPRKTFAIIAAPRGTLKSTVCSQGYPLWRMIRGEVDLRVLLDAENRDKAQERLKNIKFKLETSPYFKTCYGDWNGKVKNYSWNEESATVSVRTNTSIRESTFDTAGVDVVKNSLHYDLIICDDCHSDKNSKESTQIQKVIDHYKVLQPMIDDDEDTGMKGEFLLVCTWWDDKDANRWFVDMMGADASVFQRSAFKDDAKTIPRYPRRLSIETLKTKRKILGSRMYGLQYLLECISEEDALFREEDIMIAPAHNIPSNLRRYLLVDTAGDPTTASKRTRNSDNWAIPVLLS